MKTSLIYITLSVSLLCNAQGFHNVSQNWPAPNGGLLMGSTQYGFNSSFGIAQGSHGTGSQTWGLRDMDGDHKPDLVVYAQLQAGKVTCFSPGNSPYWNVYLNNGDGFNNSPELWSLPVGGWLNSGTNYGFMMPEGTATTADNTGSQSWCLEDMTGDGKPDLVVTAQLQAGKVTVFAPGSGQYWKVYINNGSGFNTTPVNFILPEGGKISGGSVFGYNGRDNFSSNSDNAGSQSWSLQDIDGDSKADLVVCAQHQGGQVTSFSPLNNQYWKIYKNSGTDFSTTPLNWNLPDGGKLANGIKFGFNFVSGMAFSGDNAGSQNWSLTDLNGDGKVDLVVTAQMQAGKVTSFSPTGGQYWKAYFNNGTSFDNNATSFLLPNGGRISGGTTYGFDNTSGFSSQFDDNGTQSWSLMDVNSDERPELIITAEKQGGDLTCFSPGLSQYWKLYENNGTGFYVAPFTWKLPNGGISRNGKIYGFDGFAGMALPGDNTGSQSWTTMRMHGDKRLSLVITGEVQDNKVTSFSPGPGQYWKIFTAEAALGIEDSQKSDYNLDIFPNPAGDHFTISSDRPAVTRIYNEIGQKVMEISLDPQNNNRATIVDLEPGIYFIRCGWKSGKVMILK